jgi:ribosomal protein L19E
MENKFKNFERDVGRIDSARKMGGVDGLKKASSEHDEEVIRRRKVITENLKKLCKQKQIDPNKLKSGLLNELIKEFPEAFFNLKDTKSVLQYFLRDMETLRECVLEE